MSALKYQKLCSFLLCFVCVFFQWFEFQYLTSNSDYNKVQVDDLVEFLRRYGLTHDQYIELEEILLKLSNEAKKQRILTFFKGVCKGATAEHVKAALVSVLEICFVSILDFILSSSECTD